MTATKPLGTYGNGVGTVTPLDHKAAQSALFVKTSTANLIRPGVLYNGNASLVTGAANMSYNVAPFTLAASRGATAGTTIASNDGTLNVVTTAAPGSNSRYDVIYFWPREFSIDGVDSNPVIGVVQGTAAASPTVPSLAAFPGAIELARVLVPAGVTATNSGTTFTQSAQFTSVDGGVVAFRNTTEMNLWTTAILGAFAEDLSTQIVYRWNGSSWKPWSSPAITYIPVISNFTAGSGTFAATYRFADGRCFCDGTFTLGAGSVIGSNPNITHPVNAGPAHATASFPLGQMTFLDTGVAEYSGFVNAASASAGAFRISIASGPTTTPGGVTGTSPFTFGTGDVLMWSYQYNPA